MTITPTAMTAEIEDLFEAVYRERHAWSGICVSTLGRSWIAMAGELVEGTLFVARDASSAIAATCVQTGPFAEGANGFVAPRGL